MILRLSSGYARRLSLKSRKRFHDPAVADATFLNENKTTYKHGFICLDTCRRNTSGSRRK